jgi:hypothetical protein
MSARRLALVLTALLLVPAARADADTGPVGFDVALVGSQTVTGTYAYQPPACWSLQGSSHQTTTFHTDAPARLMLRRATDGSLSGTTRVVLKGFTERQAGSTSASRPGATSASRRRRPATAARRPATSTRNSP